MAVTCYTCGRSGHIARDCGWEQDIQDPRPIWCGTCDQRTRHVDLGAKVKRCECHPESHKLPGHMRRCPNCQVITVQWDTAPCGKHHVAGKHPEYAGPARIPDDEWRNRHDFGGGLPLPPEYPTTRTPPSPAPPDPTTGPQAAHR